MVLIVWYARSATYNPSVAHESKQKKAKSNTKLKGEEHKNQFVQLV